MYVYIRSESGLWTVGFYKPDGTWEPENDCYSAEDAAERVAWLNGTDQEPADKRRQEHWRDRAQRQAPGSPRRG
jgi:hypothetical protein